MLEDSANPGNPLVMRANDTITVHYFVTDANDGFHITVNDLTNGHSGTIILNSPADGPLMPAFDTQQVGNALGWGIVFDTPNAFDFGQADQFPQTRLCGGPFGANSTYCAHTIIK